MSDSTKKEPTKKAPKKAPKKTEKPPPEKDPKTGLTSGAPNVAGDLLTEVGAKVAEEIEEQQKERTPKRGRPTKAAKQAQETEEYKKLLTVAVAGVNRLLGSRAPELAYTPDEVETLATMGAVVVAKHADAVIVEHAEEIALATAFVAITAPKVAEWQAGKRQERLSDEVGADSHLTRSPHFGS